MTEDLDATYRRSRDAAPTYPEVGATRDGPLPGGYGHLHRRVRLGRGDLAVAHAAVHGWAMQRAAGFTVYPPGAMPETGTTVLLVRRFGPLRVVARAGWSGRSTSPTGGASPTAPGVSVWPPFSASAQAVRETRVERQAQRPGWLS